MGAPPGQAAEGSLMVEQRGMSVSVFVSVVVVALLLVAGLVIDGGRKSAAQRIVQVAAADAARAGQDACAASRLAGAASAGTCLAAARARLEGVGVAGTVSLSDPVTIRVETSARVPTVFLSLMGITELAASGAAEARLFAR
jgi:hypothetical protein